MFFNNNNPLTKFTKKVKLFKKMTSKDNKLAKELALSIIGDSVKILEIPEVKKDFKKVNEINKLIDSLKLYIKNVESVEEFDRKWQN